MNYTVDSPQIPVTILISTNESYLGAIAEWAQHYLSPEDVATYWQLPLYHRPPTTLGVQNRNIGFFSNLSEGYYYSGKLMPSQPLTESLTRLLTVVNMYWNTDFNGILVNLYMDGNDYIGAHSDAEDSLDKVRRMVVGLSFGAVRTFRIRYRDQRPMDLCVSSTVRTESLSSTIVADIPHQEGMMIAMAGGFQSQFTHEIPKITTTKVATPRLSLTFRQHLKWPAINPAHKKLLSRVYHVIFLNHTTTAIIVGDIAVYTYGAGFR
jgi:alkylated DNA repair dioxygenase AlkB